MTINHHVFFHADESTDHKLDSILRKLARIEARVEHLAEGLLDEQKLADMNNKLAGSVAGLQAALDEQK